MACPGVLAVWVSLIPLCVAKLIRFRVQHRIQGLFNGIFYKLPQMILDLFLVDLYYLTSHTKSSSDFKVCGNSLFIRSRTFFLLKCAKDIIRYPGPFAVL